MKLPGLTPGEFHLPEKRLKATACGTDTVGGAEKDCGADKCCGRCGADKCGGRGKKAYGADKLTPKYHRAPRSMTAQRPGIFPTHRMPRRGGVKKPNLPFLFPIPPGGLRAFYPPQNTPFPAPFRPIKNPAVSGVCIIFKTGHTKNV